MRARQKNSSPATGKAAPRRDEHKTKAQLIEELRRLRRQVAGLKGATTRRVKAADEIGRQARTTLAINRVLEQSILAESEEELARTCLREAEDLTGSMFGFLCEVNPKGRFDTFAISDTGWDACRVPGSRELLMANDLEIRGIRGLVVRNERSMIFNDPAAHAEWIEPPEGHPGITSYMGVPLKHGGKIIGTFGLANKKPGYGPADQEAVEALAVAFVEALMHWRAEEELRRTTGNLEEAQKMAHLGSWDWDIEGNEVSYSEEIRRILGVNREECRSFEDFARLFHPDDTERNTKAIEDALAGKEPYDIEYRTVRWDGTVRWLHVQGKVSFDDTHRPVRMTGTSQDITERKRAEDALRESEERFRGVFETPMIGTLFWDADGDITDANDAFLRMVGYSRDEVLTRQVRWRDMTPEQYTEQDNKALEEIATTGVMTPIEKEYIRKDGSRVPILLGAASLPGPSLSGVAFALDISDRKRVEQDFERVFNASWDMICIAGFDGYFKRLNPAFERTLGYTNEELLARPFIELVHPDDREATIAEAERIASGVKTLHFENRYRHKDGSYVWLAWITTPVVQEGVMYSIARDITEKKRAEKRLRGTVKELERSNKELEQFAYVASHDLQEPLRMVASYTQLLERRYKDVLDDDAREFIGYAVDGANRMQQLINDLLTYSRLSTRGNPMVPTDAHAALGRAIANLQATIGESGAIVTNENLPTISADERQLVQLFQNLVGNAIKFRGEEPPRVHVSAERKGRKWVFSVRDNGIGIDPEYRERIFVIFQRLHAKTDYTGTGIGLAICHRIVTRHGGRIWVESDPGRGSTFHFTIRG